MCAGAAGGVVCGGVLRVVPHDEAAGRLGVWKGCPSSVAAFRCADVGGRTALCGDADAGALRADVDIYAGVLRLGAAECKPLYQSCHRAAGLLRVGAGGAGLLCDEPRHIVLVPRLWAAASVVWGVLCR